MRQVLIIKTSSMGDVIHALPALTDARRVFPDIQFDWVVEPGFAEIPKWHPAVRNVFVSPLRRWRKQPWQAIKSGEWGALIRQMRTASYDFVIDAQGLMKSALITRFARGLRVGLNFRSAREKWASVFYQRTVEVEFLQHAVDRARQLFAKALNYPLPDSPPDYGIDKSRLVPLSYGDNCVIFLHGTTWVTKHWPEHYWQQLAVLVAKAGLRVLLPWGNEVEHTRAQKIRAFVESGRQAELPIVLPKLSLSQMTTLIAKAKGIVAVDTGLGHIAAAMATPTVSLYGPTDPKLTGAHGPSQYHLFSALACAPCLGRECKLGENVSVFPSCFESLTPESVFATLSKIMLKSQVQPLSFIDSNLKDKDVKLISED